MKNQINVVQKINIQFFPEKDEQISELLETIKKFGKIIELEKYEFKFKSGNNYILTNNGKIATKNNGGSSWNCVVIGDKEIPKGRISKWKIRINSNVATNYSDLYIGIGPSNFKGQLYNECWSLYSSYSSIYLQMKGNSLSYKLELIFLGPTPIKKSEHLFDTFELILTFHLLILSLGISLSPIIAQFHPYPP